MRKNFLLFVAGLGVSLLVFLSYEAGFFAPLENFFEDFLVTPRPVSPELIIVAIDDESLEKLGSWPWRREIFSEALLKLDQARPRAIGLDVIFSEPSRYGAADDQKLAASLSKISSRIVFPAEVFPQTAVRPLAVFRDRVGLGHVNLIQDKDGVVRKFFPKLLLHEEEEIPAFAYGLLGEKSGGAVSRLVYSAPSGAIPRIPFWRIFEEDFDLGRFKDKIILIGATAADFHDVQLTPFSRGRAMFGVEIQANITNMLLKGYRISEVGAGLTALWIFAAGILPALAFFFVKNFGRAILASFLIGAAHFFGMIFLAERDFLPNLVHLNAAWILSTAGVFGTKYLLTEREKREIRNLFSRYVAGDVLEEILKTPSRVALGGEEKEITILFSDLKDFTTLSEMLPCQELVRILNEYFEAMAGEIFHEGGVLDKYIGDSIMAFWGAPMADEAQTERAVKAALAMQQALIKLNEKFRERGDPELFMRIGIYTGPAVVGNIGSSKRFDYTVIGDSVNVASRLEGLNKTYGTKIIVGESTLEKLRGEYGFKTVGEVMVKGRARPLKVYAL